jgi:alpha-L-rhamnosidase
MHLLYCDGSESLVLSDDTWTGSGGPVISDNIYAGETYDARLEQEGWDEPGFDDSAWGKVMITEDPGGKLISQNIPPVKKMGTIVPVALSSPKPGVFVYDMGQNFSGWVKLSLSAPRGTEIKMRFAESVQSDGMIDPASTGVYATDVVQTDKYICNGKGLEEWEPRFTYHGFRYVEITGFPGKPAIRNILGIVVHSSVKQKGTFSCSDEMLNTLHKTALWTQKSNLHGIPTDCPHRERCGWLGDAFLTSDMTIYNFDMPLFWSKFIGDIESSRRNGIPTNIAPGRRYGGSDPDWGAAYIQLPWNMYLYYGDKSIITDYYEGMCFFMRHLQDLASENIIYSGIGSLFSPGRIMAEETPVEFTSTLLYCFCADVMSKMAMVTGRENDALSYSRLAGNIRKSFNSKFYNQVGRTYGCQEMNTLALAFKMVPCDAEEAVAENLNNYVFDTHNGHVTTGIFGSRYIYETLSKYGYSQEVHKVLNNKDFPGFGYLFSLGATTFWENWGEVKFRNTHKPANERSRNHPFQGGFDVWFYNGMGGIIPDPDNPGFKHIILKPNVIRTIESCFAQYNSMYGLIKSEWINTGNTITWKVSVPVNTTATAYIPSVTRDNISEGGVPATEAEGTEFLRMGNGRALFELGSGDYEFVITLDQKNIL